MICFWAADVFLDKHLLNVCEYNSVFPFNQPKLSTTSSNPTFYADQCRGNQWWYTVVAILRKCLYMDSLTVAGCRSTGHIIFYVLSLSIPDKLPPSFSFTHKIFYDRYYLNEEYSFSTLSCYVNLPDMTLAKIFVCLKMILYLTASVFSNLTAWLHSSILNGESS